MHMGTTSALAVVSWPPGPKATTTSRLASCPSSARLAIAPPPGMSPESRALSPSPSQRFTTSMEALITHAPRLPACSRLHVRTHPRRTASAASSSLPTKRLPFPCRPWARPSMSTLRFTAGVGVGFSGACGLPMVLRARKPLTKCGISNHRHFFNISFKRTILGTQGM